MHASLGSARAAVPPGEVSAPESVHLVATAVEAVTTIRFVDPLLLSARDHATRMPCPRYRQNRIGREKKQDRSLWAGFSLGSDRARPYGTHGKKRVKRYFLIVLKKL